MAQIPGNETTGPVIFAESLRHLKRVLVNRTHYPASYISFLKDESVETMFAKEGISPVDHIIESQAERELILHDYVEAVGILGEWNGDKPQWWITDISSKNAYRSPLLQPLIELIDCIRGIEFVNATHRALYVLGASWPVILTVKKMCDNNGRKVIVLSSAWSRYWSRWHGKARALGEMITSAAGILRDVFIARKYYGDKKIAAVSEEPVYLIKSFTYPHSFQDDGTYEDPFFGDLALHLSNKCAGKIRVITVSLALSAKKYCMQRMKTLEGQAVIPIESMIKCRDVVRSFFVLTWRLIFRPFEVKNNIVHDGLIPGYPDVRW